MKELCERRHIIKYLNAMIRYGQAKLNGFYFTAETQQYGDIYRVTVTVQWKPLPLTPEITDIPKPEGSV
jgi:hypothetical protein